MHAVSTNVAKTTLNVKMTSYCDVTNSVYPVTLTTIRHSIAQYYNLLGGINQAAVPSITRPLHATDCTSLKKMSLKKFQASGHPAPHALHGVTVLDDETIECLLNTFTEIYCRLAVVWRTRSNDEEWSSTTPKFKRILLLRFRNEILIFW